MSNYPPIHTSQGQPRPDEDFDPGDHADHWALEAGQPGFCPRNAVKVVDQNIAAEQRPQRSHSERSLRCMARPSARPGRHAPNASASAGALCFRKPSTAWRMISALESVRTDSGGWRVLEAWDGAVHRGANMIILPLIRSAVSAMASGLLSRAASETRSAVATPITLTLNVGVRGQTTIFSVPVVLITRDGAMRALAHPIGIAVIDEAALEERRHHRAQRVVNDAIAKRRGGHPAALGLHDFEFNVAA